MYAYSFHIHMTIVNQLQKREKHNSLPPSSKQKQNLSSEKVFSTLIASVCLTYIGLGQTQKPDILTQFGASLLHRTYI